MNRRVLKKRCKAAMQVLIAEHRYQSADFEPATGQESVDAPPGMEARFVWRGFLAPGPLKGTPLVWERTSYECEEWDTRLPSEVLANIEAWSGPEAERAIQVALSEGDAEPYAREEGLSEVGP